MVIVAEKEQRAQGFLLSVANSLSFLSMVGSRVSIFCVPLSVLGASAFIDARAERPLLRRGLCTYTQFLITRYRARKH